MSDVSPEPDSVFYRMLFCRSNVRPKWSAKISLAEDLLDTAQDRG